MRRTKLATHVVSYSLMGTLLAAATFAFADAPAAKWYDTIGVSGYLQSSYINNLNDPHSAAGAKLNNPGRQFDLESNGFSFNSFLLQIAKPVGDADHYGFTVRLRTGQDAAAIPGGTANFVVQEAYATYVIPALTKLSIIGGKFVTPEGFEGVDSVNNPNFSQGLLFTFAEPITHTGIKANYVISDKANATLGVVNGWDSDNAAGDVPDNNNSKTLLWQIATTPIKQLTWSFQGLYGNELADPANSERLSLDTVVGYTMGKLSLNGQANWGQQTNDPNTAGTPGDRGTSHWDGLGAWLSFATSSIFTESVRFEVLSDENNANRFGATPFPGTGNTNQTVKEVTLTHKTMLTSALGTRLEYRHDWSNEGYFVKHNGLGASNQNTLSADVFVTF